MKEDNFAKVAKELLDAIFNNEELSNENKIALLKMVGSLSVEHYGKLDYFIGKINEMFKMSIGVCDEKGE